MKSKAQPLEKAEKLARVLDAYFQIPGTRLKVGIDSIIGLIPGAGDWMSGALSLYLFKLAADQNVPRPILFRMGVNVIIDTFIGSIPIAGDVFDLFWKANLKNLRLLESALKEPTKTESHSSLWIGVVISLMLLSILAIITLPIVLLFLLL